jgi:hypothetical protein
VAFTGKHQEDKNMIKRSIVTVLSLVVILWLAGASAWAQGRSGGSHPGGGAGGAGMPRGSSVGNSASSNSSSTHGSNSSSNSSPGEVLSHNNGKLNTKLSEKLQDQGLLTAGTDLKTACAGFRTLGQCIAAIHVSHNLGGSCTFDGLKSAMTGTPPESLGAAIKGCNPNVPAKAEARTATKQANADIKDSESESGPSS